MGEWPNGKAQILRNLKKIGVISNPLRPDFNNNECGSRLPNFATGPNKNGVALTDIYGWQTVARPKQRTWLAFLPTNYGKAAVLKTEDSQFRSGPPLSMRG